MLAVAALRNHIRRGRCHAPYGELDQGTVGLGSTNRTNRTYACRRSARDAKKLKVILAGAVAGAPGVR